MTGYPSSAQRLSFWKLITGIGLLWAASLLAIISYEPKDVHVLCGDRLGNVTFDTTVPAKDFVSLNANGVVFKTGVYVPYEGEICAYKYITKRNDN